MRRSLLTKVTETSKPCFAVVPGVQHLIYNPARKGKHFLLRVHPNASLHLGRARLPPPVPSLLPHVSYPLQFGDDRQSFIFVHHGCNSAYCPHPIHSDHASHISVSWFTTAFPPPPKPSHVRERAGDEDDPFSAFPLAPIKLHLPEKRAGMGVVTKQPIPLEAKRLTLTMERGL